MRSAPRRCCAVGVSYTHGMDVMLGVCAAIAVASALLGLAFLPRWAPTGAASAGPGRSAGGDLADAGVVAARPRDAARAE